MSSPAVTQPPPLPPISATRSPADMPATSVLPFLDVPTMLQRSHTRNRIAWTRLAMPLFFVILIGGTYLSRSAGDWAATIQAAMSVAIVGLILAMFVTFSAAVRGQRGEQAKLDQIEELIQLRCWSDAGLAVQNMLLRPTRTGWGRTQALIFVSGILMRYHRFTDAIAVQEYLLEIVPSESPATHTLRLGRAMALLREERLVDADQALTELRRQAIKANEAELAAAEETTDTFRPSRPTRTHASAGLALVELYRDVKTGHPEEAIKIFQEKLPLFRQQLGHRAADVYVLAARAYDLADQPEEAARLYAEATLLAPAQELHRRYPEVAPLTTRYNPTAVPAIPGETAGLS